MFFQLTNCKISVKSPYYENLESYGELQLASISPFEVSLKSLVRFVRSDRFVGFTI